MVDFESAAETYSAVQFIVTYIHDVHYGSEVFSSWKWGIRGSGYVCDQKRPAIWPLDGWMDG